jgi:folate-dependent phosphoribosylglycinamide formyltransferase PurN
MSMAGQTDGNIARDEWLNRHLKGLHLSHEFVSDPSLRWGELIVPEVQQPPPDGDAVLRLAAITSMTIGFMALLTLLAYQRHHPDRLYLTCVITDDPMNPDAKIGVRKRIWHHHSVEERAAIEEQIAIAALRDGVPVHTGDIKQPWFRDRLRNWSPDVVLCLGFGQVLDAGFLSIPAMGCCNVHPSDLTAGIGAGPAPYEGARERDVETSHWTVHAITDLVDQGPPIGLSPPINVRSAAGMFPDDPLDYYCKMLDGLDHLVFHTVEALVAAKETGTNTADLQIDFDAAFSDAIKNRMLEPRRSTPQYRFPDPALFAG